MSGFVIEYLSLELPDTMTERELITLSDMLELYCEDIDGAILELNPLAVCDESSWQSLEMFLDQYKRQIHQIPNIGDC